MPFDPHHRLTLLVSSIVVLTANVSGQNVDTSPSSSHEEDSDSSSVITLTPFEVSTARDTGFVGASALAGGRLALDLKDTPVPYSVLTRDFIDALNITDITQAVQWGVNSTLTPDNGLNDIFAGLPTFTFRGVTTGTQNRNFFPYYVAYDSYDLERYDFGRGPNSVLFGQGSLGGTLNSVTKRAIPGRSIDELQMTFGSWNNYRVTADVNVPLGKHVALRANFLWQDSDGWRDLDFAKKKGVFLTSTYDINPSTQVRVEGEYGEQKTLSSMTNITDRLSGWDGKTVFAKLPTSVAALATRNAQGFNQYGADTYVYAPATGTNSIVSYQNAPFTSAATTAGTFLDGRPIVGAATINAAATPILYTKNLPSYRYDLAAAGSDFFLPSSRFTTSFDAPKFTQRFKDFSAYLDHNFGTHFYVEAAADINGEHRFGDTSYNRSFTDVFVDLNQTLPTGALNPEFLKPYDEATRYYSYRNSETRNARIAAAYVDEFKWVKVTANLLTGINDNRTTARSYTLELPIDADSRLWPGKHLIRYRLYWDQTNRADTDLSGPIQVINPLTGVTQTMTPVRVADTTRGTNNSVAINDNRYFQVSSNLKFLSDRLVLLGAFRRDGYYDITRQSKVSGDLAAGWNGYDVAYKPDAPSDYYKLTYQQKDASGHATSGVLSADTRPRDSNGFALAQYANDRFRDDYNPPAVHGAINTFSIGGVAHVLKWLGVYANVSETFSPPTAITTFDGSLLSPTNARGIDFGLRLNLLGGRVEASIGQYRSTEDNFQVAVPSGFNSFNTIYETAPGGSTESRNIRNVADLPINVNDTVQRQASGTEFEVTANITSQWRLLANVSYARAFQANAYPNLIHYLQVESPVIKQILNDAGVIINPTTNFATVNTGLPSSQISNNAQAAATAYNNIQTSLVANLVTQRQKLLGSTEVTANIYTDYTFKEGWLRGWRLGGGVNYRGREVLGYRGGDTIADPNNPANTIDDPKVDAYTTVFGRPYYTGTGTIGYTYHFQHGRFITANLQIGNLFNRRNPVYIPGVVQRPPNGDISSPARVATPDLYFYIPPINFNFTTTLHF